MKPKATDRKVFLSLPILAQVIRKTLIIYLLSAVTVPAICFIFGWRSLENIGAGFVYGSLGLALFGVLIFAGNTVPAQLSQLSLPIYKLPSVRRHKEDQSDDSQTIAEKKIFLFTTLMCAAFLLGQGFC